MSEETDAELRAAIDIIGPYARDDKLALSPAADAAALPAAAGALARILRRPALAKLAARFTDANQAAVSAQSAYKRYGRAAILLNAAAILIGALALFGQDLASRFGDTAPSPLYLGQAVAAAQFLCVAAALIAAQLVIRLRPFERWMQARAEAEIARIALFEIIVEADEEAGTDELPALPLQLEYFRRRQLETQIHYYGDSAALHTDAATRRATRRDLYAAVSAFAAAPATFFGLALFGDGVGQTFGAYIAGADGLLSSPFLSQLLFFAGVVASSLMSTQQALSLLSQDRRNASRYRTTQANLNYLRDTFLDRARAAAAAGDHAAVLEFVDVVNEQI